MNRLSTAVALLLVFALGAPSSSAYSVLTHEQIIDLAWGDAIRPVLLGHYPNATPAQLKEAHAYAYGGCVIQDEGYYPFGHEFFSDLTHYVRTGDFVSSLIRDSRNIDELAFALGALSHYVGDSIGHHDAINPSTAIEFPNLKAKYGPIVTYDESPHAHVRTEFAFDIDQLSKKRIAPSAYLRHVGFKVPVRLLGQAFYETYGLHLRTGLFQRASIRTYRWSVRSFLPDIAYAEVVLHRKDFPADTPGPEFDLYVKRLSRADFNNGWEHYRKKAGFRTHAIAVIIFILPKIGQLSDLAIRGPKAATEAKYIASVNRTVARYELLLGRLAKNPSEPPREAMKIDDLDLDTGTRAIPGSYVLMDATYAKLLNQIVAVRTPIPGTIKRDIEAYYSNPDAPISTKKHKQAWRRVQQQLTVLESMPTVPNRDVAAVAAQGQ
ncbi:MAG: zinc dependent phospholipase C family protein [Acidobacteriaceae bacterium]